MFALAAAKHEAPVTARAVTAASRVSETAANASKAVASASEGAVHFVSRARVTTSRASQGSSVGCPDEQHHEDPSFCRGRNLHLVPFFLSSGGLIKIAYKLTTLPHSNFAPWVILPHSSRGNIRAGCSYHGRFGTLA